MAAGNGTSDSTVVVVLALPGATSDSVSVTVAALPPGPCGTSQYDVDVLYPAVGSWKPLGVFPATAGVVRVQVPVVRAAMLVRRVCGNVFVRLCMSVWVSGRCCCWCSLLGRNTCLVTLWCDFWRPRVCACVCPQVRLTCAA